MTTEALKIIFMDSFATDPRSLIFNEWLAKLPESDQDAIIELISDIVIKAVSLTDELHNNNLKLNK